jgi:hypothetical protein
MLLMILFLLYSLITYQGGSRTERFDASHDEVSVQGVGKEEERYTWSQYTSSYSGIVTNVPITSVSYTNEITESIPTITERTMETEISIFTSTNEKEKGNTTNLIPEREVKGRNLPAASLLQVLSFNIRSSVSQILQNPEMIIIIVILFSLLLLQKIIIPQIIKKIDEEKAGKENSVVSLFLKPATTFDTKKVEETRRFMRFKEHLEEIVRKSLIRLEKISVSQTIILGYQELDEAFSEYVDLKRLHHHTPLEHASKYIEMKQINQLKLKKIVHLFYLTRYGLRRLSYRDGRLFITLLNDLIHNTTI